MTGCNDWEASSVWPQAWRGILPLTSGNPANGYHHEYVQITFIIDAGTILQAGHTPADQ